MIYTFVCIILGGICMIGAVAKVFQNGRSQAIRLPKQFRISCKEVFISKENESLIITPKTPQFTSKDEVVEFFEAIHCPEFELERDESPPQERDFFDVKHLIPNLLIENWC
jgi:antitoxin VapB